MFFVRKTSLVQDKLAPSQPPIRLDFSNFPQRDGRNLRSPREKSPNRSPTDFPNFRFAPLLLPADLDSYTYVGSGGATRMTAAVNKSRALLDLRDVSLTGDFAARTPRKAIRSDRRFIVEATPMDGELMAVSVTTLHTTSSRLVQQPEDALN